MNSVATGGQQCSDDYIAIPKSLLNERTRGRERKRITFVMNNWVIWKLCVWSVWKSHFSAKLLFKLLQALQSMAQCCHLGFRVVILDLCLNFLLCCSQTENSLIPIPNTLLSHRNHKQKPELNEQLRGKRGRRRKNGKHTHTQPQKLVEILLQCLMIVFTINRINWLKTSVNLSDTNWQWCGTVADGRWTHSLI